MLYLTILLYYKSIVATQRRNMEVILITILKGITRPLLKITWLKSLRLMMIKVLLAKMRSNLILMSVSMLKLMRIMSRLMRLRISNNRGSKIILWLSQVMDLINLTEIIKKSWDYFQTEQSKQQALWTCWMHHNWIEVN